MNLVTIYLANKTDYHPWYAIQAVPIDVSSLQEVLSFVTDLEGLEACEKAFHITNAPEEYLKPDERALVANYRKRSLSSGDVVKVNDDRYLCLSMGWHKIS